jgi:hypothetical protein
VVQGLLVLDHQAIWNGDPQASLERLYADAGLSFASGTVRYADPDQRNGHLMPVPGGAAVKTAFKVSVRSRCQHGSTLTVHALDSLFWLRGTNSG